ncbi:MAG: hypothetical protein HC938_06385 [Nitrospira sp.]|nr:hypothetical protein [Nitrospira sp.]
MRSIQKVVGVMSCACLLCLGLSSTAALASDDNMQLGPSGERIGGQAGMKESKDKLRGVIADDADHKMGGQAGHKGAEDMLERPTKK